MQPAKRMKWRIVRKGSKETCINKHLRNDIRRKQIAYKECEKSTDLQ